MFSFYQITITDFPSIKKNNDKRANATKYVSSICFFSHLTIRGKYFHRISFKKERKRRYVSPSDHNDSRSFFLSCIRTITHRISFNKETKNKRSVWV